MIVSIDQQIEWMERQVRHQRKLLPQLVQSGRIDQAEATHVLACCSSALQTLTQLRGLVRVDQQSAGACPP